MPEHDVLRLNFLDLAKYGQGHSRMLTDAQQWIAEELRVAPDNSCFIVFPPHTTKWGETMDIGEQRDELIDLARTESFRTLSEKTMGVVAVECCLILDRSTIAENSARPLPIHFMFLISAQRKADGVTFKSIFAKSNRYKHKAVASLVSSMPRGSFRNWVPIASMVAPVQRPILKRSIPESPTRPGPGLDLCLNLRLVELPRWFFQLGRLHGCQSPSVVAGDDSSGMLGHLERTFYNSGRHLYTVLFKAIFSGMKLTQVARSLPNRSLAQASSVVTWIHLTIRHPLVSDRRRHFAALSCNVSSFV